MWKQRPQGTMSKQNQNQPQAKSTESKMIGQKRQTW